MSTTTENEDVREIRKLIEQWSAAVRRKDYDGALARHSTDLLMFDVPEPFQSEGIEAYRKTWDLFFGCTAGRADEAVFHFTDIRITAGADVAFATAHGHCLTPKDQGVLEPLDFRLTMGLRKIAGEWTVEHEHHSVPAS
jgi:uncharacterized protein (TIGR02246 family)